MCVTSTPDTSEGTFRSLPPAKNLRLSAILESYPGKRLGSALRKGVHRLAILAPQVPKIP